MSDDDRSSESGTTLLTAEYAEYKDGQLQIVDMPPAKRSKLEAVAGHILQVSGKKDNEDLKYVQVLDSDKNVVVDLLNLTLVKCNNGQESYRLVSNDETESGSEETVTCVLSNDDGDEHDSDSYVVMEGDEGPMVFLQSALSQSPPPKDTQKPSEKPAPTPVEILERAKSLQKAKSLMSLHTASAGRGRRRKSQLPPPHELLASPHFKLYLYSCKMCDFKCNAIKELTAHKAAEHAGGGGGGGPGKWRGGGHRASTITLQCARCPFRGNTHPQLMKHVKDKHSEITTVTTTSVGLLESAEVSSADVLVCGACGFECAARDAFKRHIVEEHGVVAC